MASFLSAGCLVLLALFLGRTNSTAFNDACPSVSYSNPTSKLPLLQFENGRIGFTIKLPKNGSRQRRCTTSRIIMANYGSHGDYIRRQNVSCQSGLKFGADACVSFTPEFLDEEFRTQNRQLLNDGQGAGLWLWKPYLVFHTLLAMQPGDILFYLDTDWDVVSNFDPYICYMIQLGLDIVPFYQGFTEWQWTKQDAVVLMNLEINPKIVRSAQHRGGFHFLRRTPRAIRFAGEWLTYSQDPRIVTNHPSIFKPEVDGFQQNRHDQTVFSLLVKKWNIPTWPDPMLPFNGRFVDAFISISDALAPFNAVDTEQPNHPVEALIHNCPPNC